VTLGYDRRAYKCCKYRKHLLSLSSLLILGIMSEILNINENLIIQRRTATDARGKVFGLRFTIGNSLMPFSFVLAGVLATVFPLQSFFIVFGVYV
jgi:DHA3 family macrolide efflux protein-like MFS transporter